MQTVEYFYANLAQFSACGKGLTVDVSHSHTYTGTRQQFSTMNCYYYECVNVKKDNELLIFLLMSLHVTSRLVYNIIHMMMMMIMVRSQWRGPDLVAFIPGMIRIVVTLQPWAWVF